MTIETWRYIILSVLLAILATQIGMFVWLVMRCRP